LKATVHLFVAGILPYVKTKNVQLNHYSAFKLTG